MKKIILNLSLLLVVLSCACEMPTESVNDWARIVRYNSFNSDNQLTGHTAVKYNASGLLMRLDIYNTNTNLSTNELDFSAISEYDSANRAIRQDTYNSNGLLETYILYKRDDSTGRTMRLETYNSNNQMTSYQVAEYLDNGLKAVIRSYDINNVSTFSNIYEYNSAFKIIKIENCSSSGCFTSFEYEYAGNQLLEWTQYSATDVVLTYNNFKYDSANRLERIEQFSSTSNLIKYDTFEYENIIADPEFIRQAQATIFFTFWYSL